MHAHPYIEQVVDLTEVESNSIYNMSLSEARERVLSGSPKSVREIDGSFSLLARSGKTVRMARSLDRPMRYFLAKRQEGPALIVSNRIDAIHQWLKQNNFSEQFHPSYTRMVPAHNIVEIQLLGCPDPDPTYTRFFDPRRNILSTDLDEIGTQYISALIGEVIKWLRTIPEEEPIGVCFSGGADSGAVFLATWHCMIKLNMNLGRLKAFTLDFGDGADARQAWDFLKAFHLEMFLETIQADVAGIDPSDTIRIVEDYKLLDIEAATMLIALCRGIRSRYPQWRYLIDGDGGDENMKDYPIEENPELTIRSVVHNRMLYHEGWGLGTIKHSLTYTGGLSRSYARTYAPGRYFGFEGFSPFTRPAVVEVAEGIPFISLTDYDVQKLYSLKGDIIAKGIRALMQMKMPVFPKRRFQHGAIPKETLRQMFPGKQAEYRKQFFDLYL